LLFLAVMKVAVLVNAHAGSIGTEKFEEKRAAIETAIAEAGLEATIYACEPAALEKTARRAAASGIDAVIAAGGDGTISAVAAALVGGSTPLAVLPLGTRNHFAKDLGVPLDLNEAARALAGGEVGHIDVADLDGHVFLNNSSIGLYPEVVLDRESSRRTHGYSKWHAFAVAAMRVLRRFPLLRVLIGTEVGSIVAKTPFVFVGNNSYQLGVRDLGSRARLDRGELSLYTVRATSRVKMFWLLLRAMFGRLDVQDFEYHHVCEAIIRTRKRRIAVAIDGEVVRLTPPLHYRIRPHALPVILPRTAPPAARSAS
jgi:diacylglycerol kinase family enzyme